MVDNTVWHFGYISRAVEILATNQNEIKKRLKVAGEYFLTVSPDGVPEKFRDDINWVIKNLTSKKALANEGDLAATLKYMKMDKCSQIASRILNIYTELNDYLRDPQSTAARSADIVDEN